MNTVYINGLRSFLPNAPVSNEQMEAVLGQIGPRPSRARRVILRSNGIRQRHYAIDPATGQLTHNNAQLSAEAIRALVADGLDPDALDLLACGSSSPDQNLPGHAVMVHGELATAPCEAHSAGGVCLSGFNALKYAWTALRCGDAAQAVACGSELTSSYMLARHFQAESEAKLKALEARPEIAFEKDFLRWMLSDGAGAAWLQPQPRVGGLSLRIDWMVQHSYAGELEACMYAGATKRSDGSLKGWREYASQQQLLDESVFAIRQDVRLLNDRVVDVTFRRGLEDALRKQPLAADDVDWFLPHYSSGYFRERIHAAMVEMGFVIDYPRWYTNLERVGNVGAASMYLMLEELLHSGELKAGQRLLCFVPESGRFGSGFMLLTAVDG